MNDGSVQYKLMKKRLCWGCGEDVNCNNAIYVDDRLFHFECFRCQICGTNLEKENYCVKSRQLCCIHHNAFVLSPNTLVNGVSERCLSAKRRTCKHCNARLSSGPLIYVASGAYHPGCFRCKNCQVALDSETFRYSKGELYCENACVIKPDAITCECSDSSISPPAEDELRFVPVQKKSVTTVFLNDCKSSPVCTRCGMHGLPFEFVERSGDYYHWQCVRCIICNKLIDVKDKWWINGTPYCERHFCEQSQDGDDSTKQSPTRRSVCIHKFSYTIQPQSEATNRQTKIRASQSVGPNATEGTGRTIIDSQQNQSGCTTYEQPIIVSMAPHVPKIYENFQRDLSPSPPKSNLRRANSYSQLRADKSSKSAHQLSWVRSQSSTPLRLLIEYQCIACKQAVPLDKALRYTTGFYHHNCARCCVCREPAIKEKLRQFQCQLYCQAHFPDSKSVFRTTSSQVLCRKQRPHRKHVELLIQPTSTWGGRRGSLPTRKIENWPRRGILRSTR